MATHSSILAWRIPKARGTCWAYIPWGCKELNTTGWLNTFYIKTLSKLEIENFLNLMMVINCITNITLHGRKAHQDSISLSIISSWRFLKLMCTELVMPSNHLIFCRPLLFWPSIFPSIRVFFKWVSSSNLVVRVLDLQLQHQSFNVCSGLIFLGLTDLISLQSKGLSRAFSNTTFQKHYFLGTQLYLYSNSHINTWLLEKALFWQVSHLLAKCLCSLIFCLGRSYLFFQGASIF